MSESTRQSRSRTLSFTRRRKSSLPATSSPPSVHSPLPSSTEPSAEATMSIVAPDPSSPPKGAGRIRRLVKRVASFTRLRRNSLEGKAQASSLPQVQQSERPQHTRSFSEPIASPKRRRSRALSFISSSSRTRSERIEPHPHSHSQQHEDDMSILSATEVSDTISVSRTSLHESATALKEYAQSSTPLISNMSLSTASEPRQTQLGEGEKVITPVTSSTSHFSGGMPPVHAEPLQVETEMAEHQSTSSRLAGLSPVVEQPEETSPTSDNLEVNRELSVADNAVDALKSATPASIAQTFAPRAVSVTDVPPVARGEGTVEEPCAAVQIWRQSVVIESFEEEAIENAENFAPDTGVGPQTLTSHEEPCPSLPKELTSTSYATMHISSCHPRTSTPAAAVHAICSSEFESETPESVVDSASYVSTEDSVADGEFIDRTIDSILDSLLATMPPTSLPKPTSVTIQPPSLSEPEPEPAHQVKAEVTMRSSRRSGLIVFTKLKILPFVRVSRMPLAGTLTWWLSNRAATSVL